MKKYNITIHKKDMDAVINVLQHKLFQNFQITTVDPYPPDHLKIMYVELNDEDLVMLKLAVSSIHIVTSYI